MSSGADLPPCFEEFNKNSFLCTQGCPENVDCESATQARKKPVFNESGSKYLREITPVSYLAVIEGLEITDVDITDLKVIVDVYSVIDAFAVTCPARAHAIKKLLCSGIRGKGDVIQDLNEARDAIDRGVQMEKKRKRDPK